MPFLQKEAVDIGAFVCFHVDTPGVCVWGGACLQCAFQAQARTTIFSFFFSFAFPTAVFLLTLQSQMGKLAFLGKWCSASIAKIPPLPCKESQLLCYYFKIVETKAWKRSVCQAPTVSSVEAEFPTQLVWLLKEDLAKLPIPARDRHHGGQLYTPQCGSLARESDEMLNLELSDPALFIPLEIPILTFCYAKPPLWFLNTRTVRND